MNLLSSSLAALPLGLAVLLAPDSAVDYRPQFVPADATFVVHLDLEGLRASTVGAIVMANRDALDLEEAEDELGFDPLTVLHSITAYGTGGDGGPSTIVVVGGPGLDAGLKKLAEDEDFRTLEEAGLDLFAVDDTFGYAQKLSNGDLVVVASDDVESLMHGVRVVRGEAPSLADAGPDGLTATPLEGSFLFATASELDAAEEFEPASQVFGLAQGIQLDIGEAGGSLFAHLAVTTDSLETAQQVSDILRGAVAFAQLVAGDDLPDGAREVLQGIQLSSRGSQVAIDLALPLDAVALILQEMADDE